MDIAWGPVCWCHDGSGNPTQAMTTKDRASGQSVQRATKYQQSAAVRQSWRLSLLTDLSCPGKVRQDEPVTFRGLLK